MLALILCIFIIVPALAVGDEGVSREPADVGTADPLDPDDADEPFMDDGGLVDIGPPGTPLPPHWRVDLSVPAVRERAETGPGRGPWSRCLDAQEVAGLTWDRACAVVGRSASAPDLSGRRAVLYPGPDCSGPERGLPGAHPAPSRVPDDVRGSLILRCPGEGPAP